MASAWIDGRTLSAAQKRSVLKGFSKRDTVENPQTMGGVERLEPRPTDAEWIAARDFLSLHGRLVAAHPRWGAD